MHTALKSAPGGNDNASNHPADSPGGLQKASAVLAKNDINVDDAYGFTIRGSHEAVFVFQVKDIKNTEKVLQEAGFSLLGDNELYFL